MIKITLIFLLFLHIIKASPSLSILSNSTNHTQDIEFAPIHFTSFEFTKYGLNGTLVVFQQEFSNLQGQIVIVNEYLKTFQLIRLLQKNGAKGVLFLESSTVLGTSTQKYVESDAGIFIPIYSIRMNVYDQVISPALMRNDTVILDIPVNVRNEWIQLLRGPVTIVFSVIIMVISLFLIISSMYKNIKRRGEWGKDIDFGKLTLLFITIHNILFIIRAIDIASAWKLYKYQYLVLIELLTVPFNISIYLVLYIYWHGLVKRPLLAIEVKLIHFIRKLKFFVADLIVILEIWAVFSAVAYYVDNMTTPGLVLRIFCAAVGIIVRPYCIYTFIKVTPLEAFMQSKKLMTVITIISLISSIIGLLKNFYTVPSIYLTSEYLSIYLNQITELLIVFLVFNVHREHDNNVQ